MQQLDDIRKLSAISSSQWGMFTAAQAKGIGVPRLRLSRLANKEQIERLAFGVYRVTGAPKGKFTDVQVAWLSVDPQKFITERQEERENGIVIGGHTAAYLFGADDLWPTPYLFISPSRKQTQRTEIQFRKRNLTGKDVTLIEGLPVTIPEFTIATLAAEGEDLSHIADVVFEIQRSRTINKAYLKELLSPYALKYGFKSRDGEAFLRYLFVGVSQAKIQEISEILKESVGNMTDTPAYKAFQKQQKAINEIIDSQAYQAVRAQQKHERKSGA